MDLTVIDITIPPNCGERLLLSVIQIIEKNDGKIWSDPAFNTDGSILLAPITFKNTDGRVKCCEAIEEVIETFLKKQKPFSFTPIEGEKEQFEILFDFNFLFLQFQNIMKQVYPVVQYIENNGGWFDYKTGQFPGFDALEKARTDGALDKETERALLTFGNFIVSYLLGKSLIKSDMLEVTHQKE